MRIAIYFIFILSQGSIIAQDAVSEINKEITQDEIRSHLTFMASDALRGRDTGSQGLEAAAAYITSHFMRWGLDTVSGFPNYLQEVPFVKITPSSAATVVVGADTLNLSDDLIVMNGQDQQSTIQGAYVGHGQPDELSDVDLRFKYAISQVGDGHNEDVMAMLQESKDKRKRIIEAGGMGLIEIYQSVRMPWSFLSRFGQRQQWSVDSIGDKRHEQFAHMWVHTTDSLILDNLTDNHGPLQVQMKGIQKETSGSSNVLAIVPGTDPILSEEYIVYGAHYDHVGVGAPDDQGDTIYNGARDNATGTTAILSLAKYVAKNPLRRTAMFVLYTAEEKGLLGSKWFVDHAPVSLDKIKYCFNIDNGGYNDTSIVSVIGLTRTEAENVIIESCASFGLEAIEDPAKEQGLFDRSDNVNFAKQGIPAPTFSLGFRSFDQEIFKYYHQPGDEVESLDMAYIEKYVKSFILSAILIGDADQNFFWNEGDKYYDKGMELYHNK